MSARRMGLWEVTFRGKELEGVGRTLPDVKITIAAKLETARDPRDELDRKLVAGDVETVPAREQAAPAGFADEQAGIARAVSAAVSIANTHHTSGLPHGVWQASDVSAVIQRGEAWLDE